MAWWIWVLGGLVLLVAEVATPGGFFAVFFAAGAILVGALKALGWDGPAGRSGSSSRSSPSPRSPSSASPSCGASACRAGRPVDRMEGETALVTEDVAPGGVGKAEMRGASWTARTAGDAALEKGRRCMVERVEGLTLWLRAE